MSTSARSTMQRARGANPTSKGICGLEGYQLLVESTSSGHSDDGDIRAFFWRLRTGAPTGQPTTKQGPHAQLQLHTRLAITCDR
jgi:hypothetical protein